MSTPQSTQSTWKQQQLQTSRSKYGFHCDDTEDGNPFWTVSDLQSELETEYNVGLNYNV